ncbi:hypothetical protein [Streptomyces sp. NPDC088746]|uniref:hypothetical protein n=1 Tax=Streptomyces sp. NPDC088746 TaxID=3365885 RepID=UPI003816AC13
MSASTAASALAALTDDAPSWLPPVDHWEIALVDGRWIVSGQLNSNRDTLGEGGAYRLLGPIAEQSGQQLADDGQLIRASFVHFNVQCDVWFLRSGRAWTVPAQCATCPTELAGTGTSYVRLGEGDREAPVICVPCRDRMQTEWVAGASAADADALARVKDAQQTVRDLRPGADAARRQIAARDGGTA